MFIVYDLIFLLFAVIYLPIYLLRRKFHRGFLSRLGILPQDLTLNQPIWIHAVSVGEAMAVRSLVEELRKTYPDKTLVISTVTPTGNKIAKSIAQDTDFVTYLPLDFSFIVARVLDKIKPALFIIAETEIWPNLICQLYKRKIPIIIVNGRISDRAFPCYKQIKLLLKPILDKISIFCVQSNRDLERFKMLGVLDEKIRVTGNMKFDFKDYADLKKDYPDYKKKLGLEAEEKLLLAGSTHPGEEEIILNVYKKLLEEFPGLRLLIAPRHPQRYNDIAKIVSRLGFRAVFISSLPFECSSCIARPVFILDSIGRLIYFYSIADIVFVGGSLVKKGGHNILEPASEGKPVLFGPYMFNFRDIAELFLSNDAAILVHNQAQLKTILGELLNNPHRITELSKRAKQLILQNQGATTRNIGYIKTYGN